MILMCFSPIKSVEDTFPRSSDWFDLKSYVLSHQILALINLLIMGKIIPEALFD